MYRSLCRLEDYKMLLYFTVTWHLKPRCLGIQGFHLALGLFSEIQNTFSCSSLPAAGISLHSCPSRLWSPLPTFTRLGTLAAGRDFHCVPENPDETLVNEHFRLQLTCFRAVDSQLRGKEEECAVLLHWEETALVFSLLHTSRGCGLGDRQTQAAGNWEVLIQLVPMAGLGPESVFLWLPSLRKAVTTCSLFQTKGLEPRTVDQPPNTNDHLADYVSPAHPCKNDSESPHTVHFYICGPWNRVCATWDVLLFIFEGALDIIGSTLSKSYKTKIFIPLI